MLSDGVSFPEVVFFLSASAMQGAANMNAIAIARIAPMFRLLLVRFIDPK